ncbi:hypothetical protein ACQP2U_23720 [Nocardia sp. CA-084685]|uniref:hypothetical protein n=1 Tax=Nocardia sp. CA-084685 TaxID=3239970 RepID=UPI003D97DD58
MGTDHALASQLEGLRRAQCHKIWHLVQTMLGHRRVETTKNGRLLDAGHSVHVIEAGAVDSDPAIHSPQGWPVLLGGAHDWGLFTTPQRHAADRRIFPCAEVAVGASGSAEQSHFSWTPSASASGYFSSDR